MSTILFIGGPADGRREPDRGLPGARVPFLPEVPPSHHYEAAPRDLIIKNATYRRVRLGAGAETFDVFIEESVTPAQAMKLLLDGYRVAPDA